MLKGSLDPLPDGSGGLVDRAESVVVVVGKIGQSKRVLIPHSNAARCLVGNMDLQKRASPLISRLSS